MHFSFLHQFCQMVFNIHGRRNMQAFWRVRIHNLYHNIYVMTVSSYAWDNNYVNKFLVWQKRFGPAQNILGPVKGQGIKINIILGLPHGSFWRRGFSMCSCNCIFQCLFWNGKLLIFLVPIGTQLPLNCWKKVFPRCRHPQFLKIWRWN